MVSVRVIASLILTIATALGVAADIIVESRATGQNYSGYREVAGSWLDSNTPADTAKSSAEGLTPQGQLGSRKTTVNPPSTTNPDRIISAARFTPPIETPGDYHVYITFPRAANATPVTIAVKHANGEESIDLAQDGWGATADTNANTWIEIGQYPFTSDGEQYVEIRVTGKTGAVDPRNPAQAYADAIRFSTDPLPSTRKPTVVEPRVATPTPVTTPATTAATPTPADNTPIPWATSLATARTQATAQGKKVFVYFYSPQSARSTDYETNVINDPQVKALINSGFIPVKIDMDTERQLSSQLQVFRAGTINIYDGATGNGLENISDTPDAAELIKRLNAVK